MVECVCPKCKAKLRIDENDAIPGCREFEEVYGAYYNSGKRVCWVANHGNLPLSGFYCVERFWPYLHDTRPNMVWTTSYCGQ